MAFRRTIVPLTVHSQASYYLHRAAASPPSLKPPPPPPPTLSCPVTVPCCSFAAPPHHVKEVFKDNEDDAGPRLNNDITAVFLRLVTDEGHDVIPRYKALQIAVRMGLDLVELLHVSFSFSVVCAQVLAIFISHGYLATLADPPEIKPFSGIVNPFIFLAPE
ncbi:Translation initiation factor IF-3 [Hordeum vulgare]|nr:Translation initiation factor IF-3 [Hordeum vulgare]